MHAFSAYLGPVVHEMVLPGYAVAPRWVNSVVRSLEIVLRLVISKFSG